MTVNHSLGKRILVQLIVINVQEKQHFP